MTDPEAVPPDFFCPVQARSLAQPSQHSLWFRPGFTWRIHRRGTFLRHLYARLPKLLMKAASSM